ncbi:MAG: response regulator transcription factor [Opitutus sp.]|nr:response regulator transcription factor [Opitutus sp.]MCS6248469.1 response regulator transcription factor [Opitutus sp.]MCS6274451.1 response regulator transcription factor [Opitutus sp.]MCS6277593.1 response regulator transcription factor [Opitutus sp.]MCS6300711.1 response regulator transcription factor [Opitutus sp.]
MKALLIDDERLARAELRTLLAAFPDIEIAGEAANATEALKLIPKLAPDLLFLDIEMPGRTGFDLLDALPGPHPHIVFVTAYNEFALRAFEVNALAYLMKPVNPARLSAALERVRTRVAATPAPTDTETEPPGAPLREDDQVFVRDGDRCWFIPVREISLLEAEGNHTRLHFRDQRALLYRTLGSMEERLPASLFVRANRGQLINRTFVDKIEPWFSGGLKASLRGGSEVEFSRRQAQVFRERLGL